MLSGGMFVDTKALLLLIVSVGTHGVFFSLCFVKEQKMPNGIYLGIQYTSNVRSEQYII
jgi:hypothetical protein